MKLFVWHGIETLKRYASGSVSVTVYRADIPHLIEVLQDFYNKTKG